MNSQTTILTIEDDTAIRQGIVDALRFQSYRVLEASDGVQGLRSATELEYDLLLLDLALPGKPGFEILQELRKQRPNQPVIVLTAKGDEFDRVKGLQLGADDYVVKPFSIRELIARIEAVLRRTPGRPSEVPVVEFPGGRADFERREIRYSDESRVELSEKEADLLKYLVANRGRAVSRDELLASVWRLNPKGISTRTIDMHIARLREKLRDSSPQPAILITVRGKGYMFSFESSQPVSSS